MKEKTKAYMAGLLDAEGSFYIGRVDRGNTVSYNPEVRLSTNHLPTIKWVIKHFGGMYREDRVGEYSWQYSSQKHAARFLDLVLPYLVLKKKEAIILKEYCDMNGVCNPINREKLYKKCEKLKDRSSLTTNTPNFPLKKNLQNAYFAGFFDGDGWVSITDAPRPDGGRQYQKVIGLSQTNLMGQYLEEIYGGTLDFRSPKTSDCQPQHQWMLRDKVRSEKFLLCVLPYLIEKRERVNLLLQFIRLGSGICPDKRKELCLKMSSLNGNEDRV